MSIDPALVDDFLLLIISSPSGAGKTTLCNKLRDEFVDLRFSVSHTTRKPRPNEANGREYYFVDEPTFRMMIKMRAFAEWAPVHDHLYGTSHGEIEAAQADPQFRGVLFDIDYQGARQIKATRPDAVSVFILPPSLEELERRLRQRGTEDEPTKARRLQNARREIEHYGFFDYVVINDVKERAYDQLRAIVHAERCKRQRIALVCEHLLAEEKMK